MFHRMRSFVAISIVLVILLIPMSVVIGQEASDIEEANRQLVQSLLEITFEDVEAELEADHSEDIWHEDYVSHNIAILGEPMSLDEFREVNASMYNAFTDLEVDVDVILGDEEYVFAHYTVTGTFTEDFVPASVVGGEPIPAHGGTVAFTSLALFHIVDGKIFESWAEIDNIHLTTQLMTPSEMEMGEDDGVVRVASHHHGAREVANEALIRHVIEETEEHDEAERAHDFSAEVWHEDYVGHNIAGVEVPFDLNFFQATHELFDAAFDDVHVEVERVIGDGEYVFARYHISGTFVEDYQPSPDFPEVVFPAHGGTIEFTSHELFHIVDGKIIETWVETDDLRLVNQLMAPPE